MTVYLELRRPPFDAIPEGETSDGGPSDRSTSDGGPSDGGPSVQAPVPSLPDVLVLLLGATWCEPSRPSVTVARELAARHRDTVLVAHLDLSGERAETTWLTPTGRSLAGGGLSLRASRSENDLDGTGTGAADTAGAPGQGGADRTPITSGDGAILLSGEPTAAVDDVLDLLDVTVLPTWIRAVRRPAPTTDAPTDRPATSDAEMHAGGSGDANGRAASESSLVATPDAPLGDARWYLEEYLTGARPKHDVDRTMFSSMVSNA